MTIDYIPLTEVEGGAFSMVNPIPSRRRGGPRADGRPSPAPLITATPFVLCDPAKIPPRRWLYGHLLRQFVSATIAPGGVGKSSLVLVEALAMATGRPLLNVQPRELCRVWMWNGEDPLEETERRITAACLHYGISADELAGRLFIDSGRTTEILLATQTRDGAKVATPLVDALIDTVRANAIDVIIIDPFVSSHRVTENDNMAINAVMKTWAHIAEVTGCAIELVHHSRKTHGAQVSVEDGRGAVALLTAARSARVLNRMTKEEAERAGLTAHGPYFRAENGKANLTPPPGKADWFKLESVPLGNGTPNNLLDDGDQVAVVTPWEWPDQLADVTAAHLRAVQRRVAQGHWRENYQCKAWVGYAVAEAMDLSGDNKADRSKIRALIKMWLGTGMLVQVERQDGARRPRSFVEVGEWADD